MEFGKLLWRVEASNPVRVDPKRSEPTCVEDRNFEPAKEAHHAALPLDRPETLRPVKGAKGLEKSPDAGDRSIRLADLIAENSNYLGSEERHVAGSCEYKREFRRELIERSTRAGEGFRVRLKCEAFDRLAAKDRYFHAFFRKDPCSSRGDRFPLYNQGSLVCSHSPAGASSQDDGLDVCQHYGASEAAAGPMRTHARLNSGILLTGSRARIVRLFADFLPAQW